MKNSRNIIITALAAIVLMVLAGAGGYLIGKSQGESTADVRIAELQEEVQSLQKVQDDAVVTKRVSEQMEDIAYQQKTIAEMQLDTAKAQKAKADAARDRAQAAEAEANRQSRLATEARDKANAMRDIAEKEKAEADAARDLAKEQLAQNEILLGRMQGEICGNRAFTQSNNSDFTNYIDADSSYYLLKRYGGNTYFSDTFKALSIYTGSTRNYGLDTRSSVTGVTMIPGSDNKCVAVTDYGEIAVCGGDETEMLMKHSVVANNNFRAVVATKDCVFAMNLNGQVIKVSYDGTTKLTSKPLTGKYFSMLEMPDGRLALAKEKGLDIIDEQTLTPIKSISTDHPISCIYMGKDSICVQFDKGGEPGYAELGSDGILEQKEIPQYSGVVTAGYYDKDTGLTMLGRKDGLTLIYNRWKHYITEIPGQSSSITSITVQDTIAVICSYDHTALICNMPMFQMYNNWRSFKDYMDMEVEPTTKGNCKHEWITPVQYTFDGWPLSICGSKKTMDVFIGTSDGQVRKMNISTDIMDRRLKEKMKNY